MTEKAQSPRFHIPATDFATTWSCSWSDPQLGLVDERDLKLLQHVNCSYLSSGKPPTLLDLKQHAHSLVNLIRRLTISSSFGITNINSENALYMDTTKMTKTDFQYGEAFDWLNNLDEPYTTEDESHHLPLWSLLNHVKSEDESRGPSFACPMSIAKDLVEGKKEPAKPYRTHHNLVMHANECLEILDHEYGATGGLLSMLPTDSKEDTEQMAAVRNTILGQFLLFTQHLVGRMHELEIAYANSLDVLAGEAVVPMQRLAEAGPAARAEGRDVAYPQDRYVLANAGDDVFEHIHRLMDKQEAQIEQKQKIWLQAGVTGPKTWNTDRGGDWYARGLVPVDVMSRFYRLKGHGNKSTLFVLPVAEDHPTAAHTRTIESQPSVVSVVTPVWPERVSELESKFKARLDETKRLEDENRWLTRQHAELEDAFVMLKAEQRRMERSLRYFENNVDENGFWKGPPQEEQKMAFQEESEDEDEESVVSPQLADLDMSQMD